MANPYESPEWRDGYFQDSGSPPPQVTRHDRRLVGHVRTVGILMIIQGAAELLAGGVLLAIAIGTPILFNLAQQDPDFPKDGAPPEEALVLAGVLYGVLAILALLAAILHIWAGIGTLVFRSRMFAIVSLAVGFVSICTCYCAPTSVAVGVYGLVVLLNAGVAEAFQQRAQGASVATILENRGHSEPPAGKPE